MTFWSLKAPCSMYTNQLYCHLILFMMDAHALPTEYASPLSCSAYAMRVTRCLHARPHSCTVMSERTANSVYRIEK